MAEKKGPLDIPDLDIPVPARVSAPPTVRASVPPTVRVPVQEANSMDDDFMAGPSLELGSSDVVIQAAQPQSPGGLGAFDDDDASLGVDLSLDLDIGGPALPDRFGTQAPPATKPSIVSPAPVPSKPGLDPLEVRSVADYGDAPGNIFGAPLYTWRVTKRRAELRELLAVRAGEATRAARDLEDRIVSFAERARPSFPTGQEAIAAAEQTLRSRDSALAAEMDAHTAAVADVDARLSELEKELSHLRADEAEKAAAHAKVEEIERRADAKAKRADIEIRNAKTLMESKGADPALEAQIIMRQAEKDLALGEIKQNEAALAQANAIVTEARHAVADSLAKVTVVRNDRAAIEARFQRGSGTRSEGVEAARAQFRAALVSFARSLLVDPNLAADWHAARDEIKTKDDAARRKGHDERICAAAIEAYDRGAFSKGIVIVIVAATLLILAILFPFLYRAVAT